MKIAKASASLFVLGVALTVNAAQTATPLCDDIVARIRAAPEKDPWYAVTTGAHPYIDARKESLSSAAYGFVTKFNPSEQLRKTWAEWQGMHLAGIDLLAGSDLHVVTSVDGSATCFDFMFFQAPQGRQAQQLPDLPRKSDHDGDNAICEKFGGEGQLAWVGEVASFVETHRYDHGFDIRVVPLRDGHWAEACAVDAKYRTNYATSKVFLPAKSALKEGRLRVTAAQIVEWYEAVKEEKEFSFRQLSAAEDDEVDKLISLLGNPDRQPFPAFGREKELAAGEEVLVDGIPMPARIGGRAYLVRYGTGQLGCCYHPGPLLIFYSLKDGKPELAGSAIVEKRRGDLQFVSARPSR